MPPLRPHPHLYEINTRPWLDALGQREGRLVTLAQVPDDEWDRLAGLGMNVVYLMGLWRRSALGRQIARSEPQLFPLYDQALPAWRARDVIGSAFCISAYEPDEAVGTWTDLAVTREKLHDRGMTLVLDYVPNHTAFDHRWTSRSPERYVRGSQAAFRHTPGAFRAVETPAGEVSFVACGRDPFFPPWTDVAQLDCFNPDARAALIEELKTIAQHADGVRCDMAMLLLNDIFARTWRDHLSHPPPATEFWADARAAVPGLVLIAEVYWDLEWRLQQLGFDFTYDKRLYDRLLRAPAAEVLGHLQAAPDYQRRSARFIENHDEARSAAAFGDRVRAVAVAMSTLEGLRFFHDGQLEGRRIRLPVQLGRPPHEGVDPGLLAFYQRLLAAVDDRVFHAGDWRLCPVGAIDDSSSQLLAWEWRLPNAERLVVVNLGNVTAQGHVRCEVGRAAGMTPIFEDLLDGQTYPRQRGAIESHGLYVRLPPGGAHLFQVGPVPGAAAARR